MRTKPITKEDVIALSDAYKALDVARLQLERLNGMDFKDGVDALLSIQGYSRHGYQPATLSVPIPQFEALTLFRATFEARLKKAQGAVIALGGEA